MERTAVDGSAAKPLLRRSAGPQAWVLGAHGMLGLAVLHHLHQAGHAVGGVTRRNLDASTLAPRQLPLGPGDTVVNCIGLINRRLGQAGEAEFLRVNSLWPRLLAEACERAGARLVHVSTDCVFAGAGAPHDERAQPDATDLYGQSKAWGEPANALVLRSSIVGPELAHRYSLMCWLLGQPAGATVPGYANHLWNGVTTLQFARCIAGLIESGDVARPGLLHLHSDDVSKLELLTMMSQTFRPDLVVESTRASEPRDMRLATCHPQRLRAMSVPPLREQIRALAAVSDANGRWTGVVA
jgi:dTDP-4-dehydrorhamnose reductase